MREYHFYALTDRQVLEILRSYERAKFIPINPYCSDLFGYEEDSFIYSHAVAKFQDLIKIKE